MILKQIEHKFCEVTKLYEINLEKFPIRKGDYQTQKQETVVELSKKYSFVPTPIFLIDTMIMMSEKDFKPNTITCDWCSGCGQYTVRLLRYLKNKFNIDINNYLQNNHYITELQPKNCAALIYILGPNINLYCGDSMNAHYSEEQDKGILFFNNETKVWENNKLVNKLLVKKTINTNIEYLTFIFNNYSNEKKMLEFISKIG